MKRTKPAKDDKPSDDGTGELARKFRVNPRTVWKWRKDGVPMHDLAALQAWALKQRKLPAGFLARLADLRAGKADDAPEKGTDAPPAGESSKDWEAFLAQAGANAASAGSADDSKASMVALARARDFAAFMFEKSAKEDAKADMKFYSDLLAKMEGIIHDALIRAKRLGIDSGELYPRAEHERIISAWAYHAMRAIDKALPALCRKCIGAESAEAVRQVLEPALLSAAYFEPFQHAVNSATGNKMPDWFAAAIKESVVNFISEEKP